MEASGRKIRVVVAKPGLDGHDRGAKIIARALRDAGMEVIYTGLHQTPEQIAETVIQEDADAIGLSILSGAHMTLVPKVVELLRDQGVDDVLVTVGGTIPADDIPELKELGVSEVFTPGAPTQAIIDFISGNVRQQAARAAPGPAGKDVRCARLTHQSRRELHSTERSRSVLRRTTSREDLRPGQRGARRRCHQAARQQHRSA